MSTHADRMSARVAQQSRWERIKSALSDYSLALARSRAFITAARLDRTEPGWHKRIDVETLNLVSMDKCILGQLYGELPFPPLIGKSDHPGYVFLGKRTFMASGLLSTPFCRNRHLVEAWGEEVARRRLR